MRLIDHGVASDPAFAKARGDAVSQHGEGISILDLFRDGNDAQVEEAEEKASLLELARDEADQAGRIARAYTRVRAALALLAGLRESESSQSKNAEIAAYRYDAGLVPAYDAELARLQSIETATAISDAEAALQQNLDHLSALARVDTDTLRRLFDDAQPVEWPAAYVAEADDLVKQRPDLLALEQRLVARLLRKGISKAEIDAARVRGGTGSSRGTAEEASAAYRQAVNAARAEADAALRAVATASSRVATLKQALDAARTARSDTMLAFANGLDRFASVHVAESTVIEMRRALTAAERARDDALIACYMAFGGGLPAMQSPAGPMDGAGRQHG